ncbi:chaperonin 10-like protein [Kockiozyma suomiensis]|uniref:chaperonin 10-like protein n=1 Tax=Kockiozyma suomiensis TaxID=1337062 RepID=UPI003343DBE6
MKALRFYGNRDVRVDDNVPEPVISKPTDVLIAPQWCGICGSDLHEFLGGPTFCPTHPHSLTADKIPVVLGHEFSGIVLAVGSEVSEIVVGDKVCVEATQRCEECANCRSGRTNCCVYGPAFYGLTGLGGGLAEKVVIPVSHVFKLPSDLPVAYGALVEPLSVAWHAVELSGFKPGMTALVLGSGPIGIATILCLQAMGAKTIIVSEPAVGRRKQAEEFDVDFVINPFEEDVVAKVKEILKGEGAERSYDCSGIQATFQASVAALAAGGIAMNIALWEKPTQYNPMDTLVRERVIMGSIGYTGRDFAAVIAAIADGRLKGFEKMITARIPMEDTVSVGYDGLINNKEKHIKILCTPFPELLK